MNSTTAHASRRGVPLEGPRLETLRAIITAGLLRRFIEVSGISRPALERAAAGGFVLKGTAALVDVGIDRLRELGELPDVESGPNAA